MIRQLQLANSLVFLNLKEPSLRIKRKHNVEKVNKTADNYFHTTLLKICFYINHISIPTRKRLFRTLTECKVFRSWLAPHDTSLAGNKWGAPIAKGDEDLCTGLGRAHWKSFNLDLKGIKLGSLEIRLGTALQCLRDCMLVRSFSLASRWRQGMEIHTAAKIWELLMH